MVDRRDEFFPAIVERAVQADAEQAVNDQSDGVRLFLKQIRRSSPSSEIRPTPLRIGGVKEFHSAVFQKFLRGDGVVAVVAFAGEDQNQIVGAREFAGAAGDFLADAADDLGLGLASGPSGAFPFAHLGDTDDWNWHNESVAEIPLRQKGNSIAPPPVFDIGFSIMRTRTRRIGVVTES